MLGRGMRQSVRRGVSELGAIRYAVAGFTFWVLADSSIRLVGESGLPAYEMVTFLGLGIAVKIKRKLQLRRCARSWPGA